MKPRAAVRFNKGAAGHGHFLPCFPQGKRKALVMSYDDGSEHDRRQQVWYPRNLQSQFRPFGREERDYLSRGSPDANRRRKRWRETLRDQRAASPGPAPPARGTALRYGAASSAESPGSSA